MSLQDSQTLSGITPSFIKKLNAMHPRQIANAASRNAAAISAAITSCAADEKPSNVKARAVAAKVNPIVWANLFGGPGTNL